MYTLADLTRMAGIKRRTVQLWAEGGVLFAEPTTERQGSGVHRTFSRDEAIICLILSRFAQWSISIGRLARIASFIRNFLKNAILRRDIERAIKGEKTLRMTIDSKGHLVLYAGMDHGHALSALGPDNETLIAIALDGALAALRSEPSD